MTLFFKRYIHNWKPLVADSISFIGTLWVLLCLTSHASEAVDNYTRNIAFCITLSGACIIGAIYKNRPRTSFIYRLRDKDNFMEVKVGDAFNNSGALVIPFNDCFDVSLGGNVKKANSLQNQLIQNYYSGREEHLKKDIEDKTNAHEMSYSIGTVIEIEQKSKTFYLLVNSRKKKNNRVESSIEDFLLSLSKLWDYIALDAKRNTVVTIPLINTNHGRITNMTRITAIKEIIDSYIEASKSLDIAEKLIIVIHPGDLQKGNINLDDINEYLSFCCKNYKITELSSKPEGKEITSSVIKNIIR